MSADTAAEIGRLPLETFRRIVGYHPFHFWGLANADVQVTQAALGVLYEYAWLQADQMGRDDIRRAIHKAERMLVEHLEWEPAPVFKSATLDYPGFIHPSTKRLIYQGSDGAWLGARLPDQKLIGLGVRGDALITAAANVDLRDSDGDDLLDAWTCSFATTVTNSDEIAIYFAGEDRDGEAASDRYRVLPVKVSISGGTCTVRGRAWQIVKPMLYEGVNPRALDPGDSSVFASVLEARRVYLDPAGTTTDTAMIRLEWETVPQYCAIDAITTAAADPAGYGYATGRGTVRDAEAGEIGFAQAVYSASSGQWVAALEAWPPSRLTVRYQAGRALVGGEMEPELARVIARLAIAEMPRPASGGDTANREISHWQRDVAVRTSEEPLFVPERDLSNPFGTRLGHIQAWKYAQKYRRERGVTA